MAYPGKLQVRQHWCPLKQISSDATHGTVEERFDPEPSITGIWIAAHPVSIARLRDLLPSVAPPGCAHSWCAHCPLKQMGLSVGQTLPQLPQFCGSLAGSTQPTPAQ
jgi:hypothetical protein